MIRRELEVSVDIRATPEEVWRVLLDFPAYLEWSCYLLSVEGPAVPGSYLRIRCGAEQKFSLLKALVLQVTPSKTFRWLAAWGVPGLLDREHGFFLEYALEGSTRLRQTVRFGGFLTPILWRRLEPFSAEGCTEFNNAIKR
ncbi:MAG: SRPBCC family protein, partial [Gammaproteobacteria bacterium]